MYGIEFHERRKCRLACLVLSGLRLKRFYYFMKKMTLLWTFVFPIIYIFSGTMTQSTTSGIYIELCDVLVKYYLALAI